MSDRYQRHCGWLPEDYNRIRSGVCVGERLEGIDLERYDEIINQMLQEQGFKRNGYKIVASPDAKTVHLDVRQLLRNAQKKIVADRDKNFEAAEAKLRAYIQEHEELKTCRVDWEEMEREKRHEFYWITLYTDDKEDAEIEWLVAYDMDEGKIRQDKIM